MRLETLGALAALAAAVLTVEQRGAASTFGLVLSYALSITMLTSMTVRCPGCSITRISNDIAMLVSADQRFCGQDLLRQSMRV